MSNVVKVVTDISENFKKFITDNDGNMFLWMGLFFGGLALFYLTYNALNKNK